jgi:hypothetical protein
MPGAPLYSCEGVAVVIEMAQLADHCTFFSRPLPLQQRNAVAQGIQFGAAEKE